MAPGDFPPSDAVTVETFALSVATRKAGGVAVCITIPDEDNPPEAKTFINGCGYLMSVIAEQSDLGYEAAMEKLMEGAMAYRTTKKPEKGQEPRKPDDNGKDTDR